MLSSWTGTHLLSNRLTVAMPATLCVYKMMTFLVFSFRFWNVVMVSLLNVKSFLYDSACTKNVVQDGRKQQDEYMTGLRPCPAAFLMLHHIFRAVFHSKWITSLPDSPFFCECAIAQKLVQHRAWTLHLSSPWVSLVWPVPPAKAKSLAQSLITRSAVAHNPDQACSYLTLTLRLLDTGPAWCQDHIHGAFTRCFFFLIFIPGVIIALGLWRWYYHLQASFPPYSQRRGHTSALRHMRMIILPPPSGGSRVESLSTKVQNHTSRNGGGFSLAELLLFVFTCFLHPTTPC